MLHRKREKDAKLDIEGLNEVISISKKILGIGFTITIIALAVLILYLLRTLNIFGIIKDVLIVISPVFIGLIIAWLFAPAVNFLQKKKLPRILACIIVYLAFIGVLALVFTLILPSFIGQIKDFVSAIPGFLSDTKDFVSGAFNSLSSNTNIDLSSIKNQIFSNIEKMGTGLTTKLPNTLLSIGKSIVSGGMSLVLGLMIGFYMLYDFDKVNDNLIQFLPKRWHDDAKDLASRINHSLREYVMGLFMVMLLVFISQSICLTLVGLKAPLIFALFCAITDIIPYFGPYIGAIPAVLVGFSISPFTGICCIVAIVIVQLLENNFYQPLIMGHAMKLHPVTIMLGLLIFQHFFGIIGMIVATPVVATIKVIFMFIDEKIQVINKLREN